MLKNFSNLPLVFKYRKAITSDPDVAKFIGSPLPPTTRKKLATIMKKLLPPKVSLSAIYDSCEVLSVDSVTEESLAAVAWRLAGNTKTLERGHAALPWRRQAGGEWMPFRIVSATPKRDRYDKLGGEFQMRILAGSACGLLIRKFWSLAYCKFLAPQIGFTKSWGPRPFKEISQLVGFTFMAAFEPGRPGDGPMFTRIKSTSFHTANVELLNHRNRKGYVCPFSFSHACHKCPIGYDQCEVATHPATFTTDFCSTCEKEGYFDPARPKISTCVNCYIGSNTRHQH